VREIVGVSEVVSVHIQKSMLLAKETASMVDEEVEHMAGGYSAGNNLELRRAEVAGMVGMPSCVFHSSSTCSDDLS
jgi:hypothetical protein